LLEACDNDKDCVKEAMQNKLGDKFEDAKFEKHWSKIQRKLEKMGGAEELVQSMKGDKKGLDLDELFAKIDSDKNDEVTK
jgi:hypothetical protein